MVRFYSLGSDTVVLESTWHSAFSVSSQLYFAYHCMILCMFLDDKHFEDVPGTGLLSDRGIVDGHQINIDEAAALKRGTGRNAHVVLIPQPSDDPHDPYVLIYMMASCALKSGCVQAQLALVEEGSLFLDTVSLKGLRL